jgi:hypothetical protein
MPTTEYFTAADDNAALSALVIGGPEKVGLPTVFSKNLDPVVTVGTLESLLTGVSYEEVIDNPRLGFEVSNASEQNPDDYWASIVAITDQLRDALVAADDARLAEVAADWARTEELAGTDPDGLAFFLRELATIAREAGNGHLYCLWAL